MSLNLHSSPATRSIEKIPTVSTETFDALISKGRGPIAVEFMSYGCSHCGALEPILQQIAEMIENKAKIFRVNVEVDPELAEDYQVQATPTLIMFLNGKTVGRSDGPSPTVPSVLTAISQPFRFSP